jgi:hypothetical protein
MDGAAFVTDRTRLFAFGRGKPYAPSKRFA